MKKNKTISTIMAATVVAGSVIPTFASEVQAKGLDEKSSSSVEIGTMNTIIIDARTAYGEVLTLGEEDEVVKEFITGPKVTLAKDVFDKVVAELEAKAKETYKVIEDDKVVEKKKYTVALNKEKSVFKYSVTEDKKIVDNQIYVTVTNNETNKTVDYVFVGVKGYDLDHGFGVDVPVTEKTIDLSDVGQYESMTRIQYELEKNADKVKVVQEKVTNEDDFTAYDLVLTVNLTDGTKIAEIKLENVHLLDKEAYVSLPVGGDAEGHWAEDFIIDAMISKWVDASATFRPNDSITRAEFVKVVNRAFGVDVEGVELSTFDSEDEEEEEVEVSFSDVNENAWYYKEVKAAVRAGYINGYEDGTFKPNQPITRQEAAKIIAKLHANKDAVGDVVEVEITAEDINGNLVHKDTKTSFVDDEFIAVWADESVNYLKEEGIINGYEDNTFGPSNDIKRAEAITMLSRAVQE